MIQVQRLVLGGPGCGKTHRCLQIVKRALNRGIAPERIAFVAFTKAAANEAAQRTNAELGVMLKELVYFRTLHSLCFRELGLQRGDVLGKDYLQEFADVVGEQLSGIISDDSPTRRMGDLLLTLDHNSRTTMRPLGIVHQEADQDVDWFRLKRFVDAYQRYRLDRGLVDFADMLERYAANGHPVPVDVAIVDEAQDLSPLQWSVVDRAFCNAKELWIAGDDDQSIYRWSGADERKFLALPYEREILPISHRLPKAIFEFGQQIIKRVDNRFAKDVKSGRPGGVVTWVSSLEEVDYSHGTWLLLARTRNQLASLENALRAQGILYTIRGVKSADPAHLRAIEAHEQLRKGWRIEGSEAVFALRAAGVRTLDIDTDKTYTALELKYDASPIWHEALIKIPLDDREYYLSARRRGERLTEEPRVRVDTIHGSKGAEADNVLLVTDLTYRVQRGYERDPDNEHRVYYVGTTRAKNTLTLLAPQTAYGYAI